MTRFQVFGIQLFAPDFGYHEAIVKPTRSDISAHLGTWRDVSEPTYILAKKERFKTRENVGQPTFDGIKPIIVVFTNDKRKLAKGMI